MADLEVVSVHNSCEAVNKSTYIVNISCIIDQNDSRWENGTMSMERTNRYDFTGNVKVYKDVLFYFGNYFVYAIHRKKIRFEK